MAHHEDSTLDSCFERGGVHLLDLLNALVEVGIERSSEVRVLLDFLVRPVGNPVGPGNGGGFPVSLGGSMQSCHKPGLGL